MPPPFRQLERLVAREVRPPDNPELCLCALVDPPNQSERNEVVLAIRRLFPRIPGLTEDDRQALNALAVHLMAGDPADLRQWCQQFHNNPTALARHFENFSRILEMLNIRSRVQRVFNPAGQLVAVSMDINLPVTERYIRLASHGNIGWFVVERSTEIVDGQPVPIVRIVPNHDFGEAAQAVQLGLVEAARRLRQDR